MTKYTKNQQKFINKLLETYSEGDIITIDDLKRFKESLTDGKYPTNNFFISKSSPFRLKRGLYVVSDPELNLLETYKSRFTNRNKCVKKKSIQDVLELIKEL